MGVYSMINESVLDNIEEIECPYDNLMEATYNIIAEGELNYNNIMKAIGIHELAEYEATGEEMVYEAGNMSSYIETVKQWFINIWKKIQGLFTKFYAIINSYLRSDEAFVSKYKERLKKVSTSDFKYNGFDFKIDALDLDKARTAMDGFISGKGIIMDKIADHSVEKIKDSIKAAEDKKDLVEEMRGKAVGGGSQTSGEFAKHCYSILRNGKSSKEIIKTVNVDEQINIISNAKKAKETAKKNMKSLKEKIDKIIKALNESKGKLSKDADDKELRSKQVKCISDAVALYKTELDILKVMNGSILTAVKDQNRQAKAICVSLIGKSSSKKDKKEKTNESFLFGDGGFLDNIELI